MFLHLGERRRRRREREPSREREREIFLLLKASLKGQSAEVVFTNSLLHTSCRQPLCSCEAKLSHPVPPFYKEIVCFACYFCDFCQKTNPKRDS